MASDFEPISVTPQKTDPAWKHVQLYKSGDRVILKCIYCGKIFKGGGIHRFKEHLAGQKGNASVCPRVLPDVKATMLDSLSKVVSRKTKKQKIMEEVTLAKPFSHDGDVFTNHCDVNTEQLISGHEPDGTLLVTDQEAPTSSKAAEKRKRGRPRKVVSPVNHSRGLVVACNLTSNIVVPIEVRDNNRELQMAIGRFFYDVGLPLDAVNSVYFQPMVEAIASHGTGVVGPTSHDLRGWILRDSLEEVKANANQCKRSWARTGCSVLVEEFSSEKGRRLVNFLVDCTEGMMFLKSVDITDIMESPDGLYELLKEVVEEVGVENVLQMITKNEEPYVGASKRLFETYPSLYWAPCAVSSIALMLEDIEKLDWVTTILEQSKSMTRFIYNNNIVLNMTRSHTSGVDVVVPGDCVSITSFQTMKRILELKHRLRTLVTSQEWVDSLHSKKEGGLVMLDSMSDEVFWSSCDLLVRLTEPLLRVLRILSCEKRPAMGYIYAAVYRAKETIKRELGKREDYMVYWNIIDHRWGQHHNLPLHSAGFYLNPKFYYSIELDLHGEVLSGVFDCIEKLVPDTTIQDKIMKEVNTYKNASGDLGRKMAIRSRDTMLPDEWWSTYGGGCPNLARLAIRILSQRCSLIQCKRNLIPFEQIQETYNSLERQRLNDMVFTRHNLRLKQMAQYKNEDSLDPIAFDIACHVGDWVAGDKLCSDDQDSTDWMKIELPSLSTTLTNPRMDEIERLTGGFDDYEIFSGLKDVDQKSPLPPPARLPLLTPHRPGSSKTSGNSISPSKYLITCLIVGRLPGESAEQMSPSFNTRSIASTTLPNSNLSHTKSTSTSSSGKALGSMGLLPQATSSKNAPKANTSELVVGFPVRVSSGAK
ncbi:hypothetical protein V2J09_023368 [Rumex salicifolius]